MADDIRGIAAAAVTDTSFCLRAACPIRRCPIPRCYDRDLEGYKWKWETLRSQIVCPLA